MKKKFLLLGISFCLCFAGCGKSEPEEKVETEEERVEETTEDTSEETEVEETEDATATTQNDSGAAGYLSFKESDITDLINRYYSAYCNGDVRTIKKLTVNFTDAESSYIEAISQYYSNEEINKIIYAEGVDENSVCVGVICDITFSVTTKPAPGLDFFYIENVDGKLVIDSTYCAFNSVYQEVPGDDEIEESINNYIATDEFLDLSSEVDSRYNTFIEKNPDVEEFISGTLTDAIIEWQSEFEN